MPDWKPPGASGVGRIEDGGMVVSYPPELWVGCDRSRRRGINNGNMHSDRSPRTKGSQRHSPEDREGFA